MDQREESIESAIIKCERADKQFDEDLQKLKSVDYETQEVVFEGSEEWSAEELSAAFNKLTSDLYVIAYDFVERWGQCLVPPIQPSNDISPRTPDVIKKELKHAKNPMEIKRLNKELTTYYKEHKKHKGGNK